MLGTTDNLIMLIDSFEGKLKHKFKAPFNELSTGTILEAGFSPDSKYLITGSEAAKQKIMCWNIEANKEIKLMDFHPTTVQAVKFSHVYCMIVSACQNLVVWIPDSNHQSSSSNLLHQGQRPPQYGQGSPQQFQQRY